MAGPASAEDPFPSDAGPWADPHGTIASILGPGQISSAVRSPVTNARVGGSPTSSHLDNKAVDWIPADGDTRTAAQKLATSGVPYDQIIDEGTHVHVGFGPKMRQQALTSVPAPAPDATSLFPSDASTMFPASLPPVPKLPPKAVPVPPSLLDRATSYVKGAGANLLSDINARGMAGVQGVKEGLQEMGTPYDPDEDPLMVSGHVLSGALKAGGGAFSTVMAPISGLAQNLGRSAEIASGGKVKKESFGDFTDAVGGFFVPGAEGASAAKLKPIKTPIEIPDTLKAADHAGPGETTAPAAPQAPPAAEDLFPAAANPNIRVYQGSPHTFEGRPNDANIGTGEGAASYGHGHYFAENPLVAQHYQEQLGGHNVTDPAADIARTYLSEAGGDRQQAIKNLNDYMTSIGRPGDGGDVLSHLENPPGRLYETDIPGSGYLDWYKPLSEQNPEILKSIGSLSGAGEETGAEFYDRLVAQHEAGGLSHDSAKEAASSQLSDAGLNGIKYTDAGSRSGDLGTSNYVLFKGEKAAPMRLSIRPAAEDLFPDDTAEPDDNVVPFPKSRTLAAAAESDDPELVGSAHVGDGGPVVGDEADPVERVDNALYRLSGHKEADKVDVQQFLKAMPDEIKDPAVQEELYHAIEQKMVDPNAAIPEHLQPAFEAMAGPYKEQTDLINHLRDLGDPEAEHYGYDTGYVARRAEGHTPLFDDTEGPSRGDPILGTKPTLTARAQAQKQRTAGFMATDQDGNTVFTDTPDRTDIMDRPYASVRPATTAEIEANTGTTYHKNALVNTLDNVMHLRQVVRNHEVLDELKQNLIDQGLAHRDEHYFRGEDGMMNTVQANSERPEGFRQVPSVPQLKGMSFAPHIAEVLEDNFNRPLPGDPLEALSKVNRALTVPMFITPVIHAQNVAVHWGIGRGFDWVRPGGMKSLLNDGASAIHQVLTMGPIYKDLIRDGMAGQFIGTQTRDFHAKLLKAAGREMDPEMQSIFAKAAGVPWKAIKAAYDTSSKALWYVNDVMLMQRVLELKRKGMSTHAAIYEAEREIPNYRIPPRVGGTKAGVAGRTASRVLQSSAIGMFNRYKYGAARAWAALAKDLAKGDASQRAEAVGKLLVAIVTATAMYPAMDWAAQKATGNKNARFKRAGGLSMTDAAYDMATGQKDPSLASSTFFSPGPLEQLGTGIGGNHDFFGRDIRTPGAPPWYQSAEAAKYLGTQGFYPGRLADQTVAGHGDQALGALAGLQLPTDKQMQNKTKFAAKDKAAGARVVGRTSNLVRQGKVGQAIDELGKDPH